MKLTRYAVFGTWAVCLIIGTAMVAVEMAGPHPDTCAVQVLTSEERIRDTVDSAAYTNLVRDVAAARELQEMRAALVAMNQRLHGLHPGWSTDVAEGETP